MSRQSLGWWTTANDQTTWEPEGPAGELEMNGVEQKYVKHDRLGRVVDAEQRQWCSCDDIACCGGWRSLWRSGVSFVLPEEQSFQSCEVDSRTHHGSCQASAECCGGLEEMGLFSSRNLFWNEIPLLLWSEQFRKSTRSGIVTAGASDFTDKVTCTTRPCELAMSHRSLHRSYQPRRAGPGLMWTMEIVMNRMKRINLRSSGKFSLLASLYSWRGGSIFRLIMLCSHPGATCV